MNATLDRIQKLMRLATNNPNAEEARSAAVKCLELMVEHNVTVSMPATTFNPVPSQSQYDVLQDLMRRTQGQNQSQQSQCGQFNYADMFAGWNWKA